MNNLEEIIFNTLVEKNEAASITSAKNEEMKEQ